MTESKGKLIKLAMERRLDGWTLFNRLNPDPRLKLEPWGYDDDMDWLTMRVKFCDKDYLGEPIPIDSEEDGLEAIYYAFKWDNERFSENWMHRFPEYEIRINALNDRHYASIRINGKWTRINPHMARRIINHPGIKVIHSNREAYISDCKYVDWFELGFDLDYFEEN